MNTVVKLLVEEIVEMPTKTTMMIPRYDALGDKGGDAALVSSDNNLISVIEEKRFKNINKETFELRAKTHKMIKGILRRAIKKYSSGYLGRLDVEEAFRHGFWRSPFLLNEKKREIVKKVLQEEVSIISLETRPYMDDPYSYLLLDMNTEDFGKWLKTPQAANYL